MLYLYNSRRSVVVLKQLAYPRVKSPKKMLKDESVGTLSFSDDLSEATNDNCMLDSRRKEDELDLSALYRLLEMWVSVSRLTVTLYRFSAQCVLLC